MAEYLRYLTELGHGDNITALAKEILTLRQMLWLNHGHKGMYGDDGEMQCGECSHEYGFWDWKRTSIAEIQSKMMEANLKKYQEQRKEPK